MHGYPATMNTSPSDIPSAHFDARIQDYDPCWIILNAYRAGTNEVVTNEVVTVEMSYGQWLDLPPVEYVIKLELSRQQPRCPRAVAGNAAETLAVPRGHVEWKDGQNWVVITAFRAGTQDPVTVEMTLGQWFGLKPVGYAVMNRLESWQERKMLVR
jgi:hypothetical protein